MVIADRAKRTRKINTTMGFETMNVMLWNGFSWIKIASCDPRL